MMIYFHIHLRMMIPLVEMMMMALVRMGLGDILRMMMAVVRMMMAVRMMMMAVVRMGLGDILAVAGGSDAVWLPPPLLIIDSVLMSALLGRSRDGSDTNGLPPLSHCEVPPLLLLALVVLSK